MESLTWFGLPVVGATDVLPRPRQALGEDQRVEHRVPSDQMLLDDSLENRWVALSIPGTFRIHHGDRSTLAYSETVRFGPENTATIREPELLEPSLQVCPGHQSSVLVTALGLSLVAAEKDVTLRHIDAEPHSDTPLICATALVGDRFRHLF